MMNDASGRRGFIRTVTVGGAGLALASKLPFAEAAGKKKSVLVFTKSSGFEHAVVKVKDGQPSVAEKTVRGAWREVWVRCDRDERRAGVRFEGISCVLGDVLFYNGRSDDRGHG